ncbi:MAG: HAD-IA family hydrolase [Betaproteobacteria bacterium]
MTAQPRIRLLSFDLDGTLVDTAGEIAEAANRALAEHGLPSRPEAAIVRLIGHGGRALMAALQPSPAGPAPTTDALYESFERHYARTTGTLGLPYPGAARTLQRLRDAGVQLACVTNKEERLARRLLEHHGLDAAFHRLIGGDTLPFRKPHPGVLQHLAADCGVALAAVAHVGDSVIDVQAAREAGVLAWAVPWGYNGGQPIASAGPDRVFHSLPAVADHVLQSGDPPAP